MPRYAVHRHHQSLVLCRQDRHKNHIHSIFMPIEISADKGVVTLRTCTTKAEDAIHQHTGQLIFIPAEEMDSWLKELDWLKRNFYVDDIIENPQRISLRHKLSSAFNHIRWEKNLTQWFYNHQQNKKCHEILTNFFAFAEHWQEQATLKTA